MISFYGSILVTEVAIAKTRKQLQIIGKRYVADILVPWDEREVGGGSR